MVIYFGLVRHWAATVLPHPLENVKLLFCKSMAVEFYIRDIRTAVLACMDFQWCSIKFCSADACP